ncbi:hypothetical protein F5148DRAFT_631139 [Russula earlei]|uniref:Uncharacterized protein n=1 Tax=Russula earlei TaxID=71964 RepID=A0ACC0UGH4_9AGAM|nr:hypothetical protein F5148DRAFT_631139 [Russula earlei]
MLRSTITTGSYILEKYSRSYPSYVSAQTQSQDFTVGQPEWQHFSNPVITLTLDVKKSMDNNFESVCLRILWNMDIGQEGNQREITMEDLDLLTFSSLNSQFNSVQGPPLKAVYRGPVVGIRYQYPLTGPATSPMSYRRFQVNFTSASDAAQFIEAIRPVCPCKENAGPPPPQISTSRPPLVMSASIQAPSARAPLVRAHTSVPQRPSMPPPSAGADRTIEYVHHHHCDGQEEPTPRSRDFPPPLSSELSLAPPSSPAHQHQHPGSAFDRCPARSSTLPEMDSSQVTAQSRVHSCTSSFPASSQLSSSAATLAAPPPSLSPGQNEKAREAFLESLRETPELYTLTRAELENLVSVIVREPGFPKLLEALDSMWVIRGFLGR